MSDSFSQPAVTGDSCHDAFWEGDTSFRSLIESSPDVFSVTTLEGRLEYVSPAVYTVLGYLPSELVGRMGFEFIHPEEAAGIAEVMKGLLGHPGPLRPVRYRCRHKNGSWRQLESRGFSSQGEGQVARILTINRDVTEQSQAEADLQESRERLALALDAAKQAPWEIDLTSGATIASARLFELFGVRDHEQYSSRADWRRLVLPEDRPLVKAAIDRAARSTGLFLVEYRIRRASDGAVRWIRSQGRLHRNKEGRLRRLVGVAKDITEHKLAEKALRDSEESFRRVVESISDALIIDDAAGNVVFANDRFLDLFGLDRNRVESISLSDYVAPEYREELLDRHKRRIRGETVPKHFEYEGIRTDGERIWLEVDVTPVIDEKGVTGTQSAIRDITARKHAEQELRRSSRRFSLLAWTSNQLLLAREPAANLRQLSRQAMVEMGCELFLLYLADCKLHLDSSFGLSEQMAASVGTLEFGEAICGIVAQNRKAIVVESVAENETPEVKVIRSWGVRAFACYPLVYRDRIVGTLAFGTFSRNRFNPDELALMESFSNQIAIAMGLRQVEDELLAMHEKEKKHAAELERRVQERTSQLRRANEEIKERSRVLEALTRELTETENRERRRMAEMLHDGLQQLVVAAQLSVRVLQGKSAEEEKPEIERIANLLTEALQASRTLTCDLCPPALSIPGLAAAFVWLAGQMREKYSLEVDLGIGEDVEPHDESAKIVLFNGVRELLFNVVKHARTSVARLRLSVVGDDLRVEISDTGVGFDPRELALDPSKGGFGLFSLRERIVLFGGSVKIDSTPGRGTVARVQVPRKVTEKTHPDGHSRGKSTQVRSRA